MSPIGFGNCLIGIEHDLKWEKKKKRKENNFNNWVETWEVLSIYWDYKCINLAMFPMIDARDPTVAMG